jgi:hypothetical protein
MTPQPTITSVKGKYSVDFSKTFDDNHTRNVLDINQVAEGDNLKEGDVLSPSKGAERKHDSGWTIKTDYVCCDYYAWVESFEAIHKKYGKISGNFSEVVVAKSKKAYDHFCKNHPFYVFDLWDI